MNTSYVSLIAMVVAVFCAGMYLRGESVRKQEIKKEIQAIKERQQEILGMVAQINQIAMEKDKMLLAQIDSAQSYIQTLNDRKNLSYDRIKTINTEIEKIQVDIDSSRRALNRATRQGFGFVPKPVPLPIEE